MVHTENIFKQSEILHSSCSAGDTDKKQNVSRPGHSASGKKDKMRQSAYVRTLRSRRRRFNYMFGATKTLRNAGLNLN